MIRYLDKTVFNSGCDAWVNTVNCVGVMGAGLALEFGLRYPEMKKQYEKDCTAGLVKTGYILTYKVCDALIVSFPTKQNWKDPSKIEWIKDGLIYLKNHYKEWHITSIAIPPLGCSNGGLDYKQVKPLIESILGNLDIDVCVCLDSNRAEGKEKEMLDAFNESDIELVCDNLKIKGKVRTSLLAKPNIRRFYDIKKLPNVGMTTYKKLFELFYLNSKPVKKEEQPNLFDLD